MDGIEILRAGLFTTIQDRGRTGYSNFGVPKSGSMDLLSATRANLLLNNSKADAVMEITLLGPHLRFTGQTNFVVTGANFELRLNGSAIENDKVYAGKKGDILSFGKLIRGCRAYLAVKGGFQTESVLNSRSMYEGLTKKPALHKGDLIPYQAIAFEGKTATARIQNKEDTVFSNALRVFKGPEFNQLNGQQRKSLFRSPFTVTSQSNRMAYQFKEKLPNELMGIITGPVVPGTVQLTPSGVLMILMRDAQVTGGYPRILQLSDQAICSLSQQPPDATVRLELDSVF